jgi:hypothetical protein
MILRRSPSPPRRRGFAAPTWRDAPLVEQSTVTAARWLNRAAGTLAASVFADSAVEHYRGSFKNKAMVTPLIVSALSIASSVHGTADQRPGAQNARDFVYLLAAVTGLVGTGFHFYNVGKRTGGLSWQNLFYGPRSAHRSRSCSLASSVSARSVYGRRHAGECRRFSSFRPAARWRRSSAPVCWVPRPRRACSISAARFKTR